MASRIKFNIYFIVLDVLHNFSIMLSNNFTQQATFSMNVTSWNAEMATIGFSIQTVHAYIGSVEFIGFHPP